ncbi:MAG: hypothetical protein Q4F40_06535, partial [Akkermansia sp.]|nr:hypothetical protein [Akkermansia sp.]
MPEQLNLKRAKKDDKKELRKLAFWKLSKGEAPKSVSQQLHISVTTIRNWNRKLVSIQPDTFQKNRVARLSH